VRCFPYRVALLPLAALAFSLGTHVPAHAGARQAPAFSVRSLDGKTLKLNDFKGRPVLIDFWATWCQPCRASMTHLETVQKRYESRGLVVLGLSVDEDAPADVKRYAQKLGVSFRLAMADEKVLDLYGPVRSIPTTFFINRQGEVVRRVVGYIDGETLESYIQELF
jgi:cytochrome c biogenesis protein CcmG/thiol:disulfide interchange protein DsbE